MKWVRGKILCILEMVLEYFSQYFYINIIIIFWICLRFGRVPALETLVDVRKGEELFSHYKVVKVYLLLPLLCYNSSETVSNILISDIILILSMMQLSLQTGTKKLGIDLPILKNITTMSEIRFNFKQNRNCSMFLFEKVISQSIMKHNHVWSYISCCDYQNHSRCKFLLFILTRVITDS